MTLSTKKVVAALLFTPGALTFSPTCGIQSTRRSSPRLKMAAGLNSEAANQNVFGIVSDAVTGAAFSLLHAFDDCGIEDSSKNLRVLWVRALLNQKNMIQDDVAETLLPKSTRSLVNTKGGAKLFDPIVQFTEWIQARTEFIDNALDRFLESPVCTNPETGEAMECNIVLFGAGYDTRALRYRHRHDHKTTFIEVDLLSVVEGKQKLYKKFRRENDPTWDLETQGSSFVPFDLNTCGGDNPKSLVETLRTVGGLKKNVPTLFVWEAVLFYVDEDAVRNIMKELADFAQIGGNGDAPTAETMLCFTDSLKPFVDVPFTNEANKFFKDSNLDLLQHRSRWGGAVHFALASTKGVAAESADVETGDKAVAAESKAEAGVTGRIGKFVADSVGGLVFSYTPTQANNPALLEKPAFDNAWYAVGYSWQMDGYENAVEAALNKGKKKTFKSNDMKPFATRLWGEPIVIYRDNNDELVARVDSCPHRSAALSMGTVEDGKLTCFYHGWKFGDKGKCTDIPTLGSVSPAVEARSKAQVDKAGCSNIRAVAERDGLVYVWRGNVLEANPDLLPSKRKGDMETVPMDSVLDYNVDYSYIVENNLDSPHLFYLHDGSVPPIEGIGLLNENLPRLRLTAFTDDCGFGHLGRIGASGRPKKLIRFDPPNIVRHGGVSGFEEEFHCVPVAPGRARVLIRQHLPKGPILSTLTSIPFMIPFLTALVNSWNYHIGLEDAAVMQGQAHRIEDLGAPRMTVGGLGDDLIKRYWKWRRAANASLKPDDASGIQTPYFSAIQSNGVESTTSPGIPTGTAYTDEPESVARLRADSRKLNIPFVNDDGGVDPKTGNEIGSWGIKQNYVQNTPAARFPPMNYKPYADLLVLDDFVKKLLTGQEPSSTMIKKTMTDLNTKDDLEKSTDNKSVGGFGLDKAVIMAALVMAVDRLLGGAFARSLPAVADMLPEDVEGLGDRLVMMVSMFQI